MRILIYKQTHIGDPDRTGCWGKTDCMGRVKGLYYDAVIGVGGIGPWPRRWHSGKSDMGRLRTVQIGCIRLSWPYCYIQEVRTLRRSGRLTKFSRSHPCTTNIRKKSALCVASHGKEHKEAKALLRRLSSNKRLPNKRIKPTFLPPLRCGRHPA